MNKVKKIALGILLSLIVMEQVWFQYEAINFRRETIAIVEEHIAVINKHADTIGQIIEFVTTLLPPRKGTGM